MSVIFILSLLYKTYLQIEKVMLEWNYGCTLNLDSINWTVVIYQRYQHSCWKYFVAVSFTLKHICPHSNLTSNLGYYLQILCSVSNKCPGLCKCLRFSKSGFAIFSNSAGCQNWQSLSASDQLSMMVMATKINSILTLLLTYTIYYML